MLRRNFLIGLSGIGAAIEDTAKEIRISTTTLAAAVRKRGYVSGVAEGSFLDKKTGFRDAGFGLDIVDWLMEPGSDEAYRGSLDPELVYEFNNLYHGRIAKRSIEGPQICTKARELTPRLTRGKDFVAVEMSYRYHLAAPGKKAGSVWRQRLVFPYGNRWFLASDWIETVNSSEAMFLRIDLPGHIKHHGGDTFDEVYLSYHGRIPAKEFLGDFPPDARFLYTRGESALPQRMIRAYRLRQGPWLAGMVLKPSDVYQAWCHQRGYVCMIVEIGGRPVRPGDRFGAAYVIGYFDSIEEMERTYDRNAGHSSLRVSAEGWSLG
jgi:hypothetical protein